MGREEYLHGDAIALMNEIEIMTDRALIATEMHCCRDFSPNNRSATSEVLQIVEDGSFSLVSRQTIGH